MKLKIKKMTGGFTLIEVIITIVVLAILGAMMVPYLGKSLSRSGASIFNLNKSQQLNTVMERISAMYAQIPRWRKSTSYPSGTIILSTAAANNQGSFSSSGGTSDAIAEPLWNNLSAGAITIDGTITWTYVGTSPELTALQTAIGTEGQEYGTLPGCSAGFGCYRVIDNHFIKFNSKVEEVCLSEATCPQKFGLYLKVTIGFRTDDPDRTGETLTALFVRR